ncbi:MAG: CehA/McbA family metallohydrolase [Chloroflexota bacterium]|nr:CehA/McbA family metallohydrolase [Chloroflexota bacterium]MDE2694888.1 CehA/McbA family metallohydrolase [Chloroflexota bacterium]
MPGGVNHDGAGGPGSELGDVAEARLPGGAVLDLHCHSSERSLDSGVRAEALVAQAVARGLDGVCLTEHNAIWPEADVRALGDEYGVSVIRGMEVNTQIGHVLVFGLDRYRPQLSDLHLLRQAVVSEGGAMVWAHPMRQGMGTPPSWKDVPDLFEAIEVVNGDHSDQVDGYWATLAEELGVGRTGGSDAHSLPAVGRVGTGFPEPVPDVETIVRLLKLHRHAPLDFRPGGAHGLPHLAEPPQYTPRRRY